MKKYYYNCPRGFSNEFSIISVDQSIKKEVDYMEKEMECYRNSSKSEWQLKQITYKDAMKMIRAERATKRSYLAAGMNLVCNPVGATEIITASEIMYNWG